MYFAHDIIVQMPRILHWNGYVFFFFSNEGLPLERCHIHVRKEKYIAKFWMEPSIALASSWGFSSKELNAIEKYIVKNSDLIRSKWDDNFN